MDYTNKALGLRTQTQIPLNVKEYIESEEVLKDLGLENNLAFLYEKGLVVYCIQEGTRYEWKEVEEGDIGLLDNNFIYPNDIVAFGIDYSNKEYNFVEVKFSSSDLPPLERIDQGNGFGIIIRGRSNEDYLPIGNRAVDLSYSKVGDLSGASGIGSFTANTSTIASAEDSAAFNNAKALEQLSFAINESEATGFLSFSFGSGKANGQNSMACGVDCIASEQAAVATGTSTIASGESSNAINFQTEALAGASSAAGDRSIARGQASHAGGQNNETDSHGETAIGTWGTLQSGNPLSTAFIPTDRLFNIGNGFINPQTSVFTRSDALTLLKNGLMTLPSVNNTLLAAASGKAVITKEYLNSNNSQKIITTDYTIQDIDFNQTIFINNSTSITITIPSSGLPANFCVGFIHETNFDVSYTGSGVSNPIGLKSKGQGYQQFIERKLNTSKYYLLGNTKA